MVSVQLLKIVNCRTAATSRAKTRQMIAETAFMSSKLWVDGDEQYAKAVLPSFVPAGRAFSTP